MLRGRHRCVGAAGGRAPVRLAGSTPAATMPTANTDTAKAICCHCARPFCGCMQAQPIGFSACCNVSLRWHHDRQCRPHATENDIEAQSSAMMGLQGGTSQTLGPHTRGLTGEGGSCTMAAASSCASPIVSSAAAAPAGPCAPSSTHVTAGTETSAGQRLTPAPVQ